jgi:hypothetical protein
MVARPARDAVSGSLSARLTQPHPGQYVWHQQPLDDDANDGDAEHHHLQFLAERELVPERQHQCDRHDGVEATPDHHVLAVQGHWPRQRAVGSPDYRVYRDRADDDGEDRGKTYETGVFEERATSNFGAEVSMIC